MFKSIKSLFNKVFHRKEETAKVMRYTVEAKQPKQQVKKARKPRWVFSHPLRRHHFGTFSSMTAHMIAYFRRTDFSKSAMLHTKRVHGLLPTRAEVRRRRAGKVGNV